MSRRTSYTDAQLRDAVEHATSIADLLRLVGLVPRGGNYETIRRKIRELQLDTSHFVGKGWRKGSQRPVTPARSLEEVLTFDSSYPTYKLKRRLLAAGIKKPACEMCKRSMWNGKPIPLELDHVNGDRSDNRIENLRILCPNCHAQTPTYRGRNIGNAGPRIPIGRGKRPKHASVWVRPPPGALIETSGREQPAREGPELSSRSSG
jgi:5-methylcytosine-specific restriction endonuclease McrA